MIAIVGEWTGVQVGTHRFGGLGFKYRGGELGHFHSDSVLDLAFPAHIGERLIGKGWADLNHLFPVSGWVTFRIESDADIAHAVRLLRIAYRYRRLRVASFTVH
ncbi:MAG: luciferase family protein [Myxococcota bacterium]|nr:luciferase family protein [Myxococcota bacterium]